MRWQLTRSVERSLALTSGGTRFARIRDGETGDKQADRDIGAFEFAPNNGDGIDLDNVKNVGIDNISSVFGEYRGTLYSGQ
jgi:hypothetical protein